MVQFGADGRGGKPGARQIYEALRDQIIAGVYPPESQIPSSRGLADELGVARTTVTVALEQLAAEGFIEITQGRRPRVVSSPVRPAPSEPVAPRSGPVRLSAYGDRLRSAPPWTGDIATAPQIDFRYGDLAPGDFPSLLWRRALTETLARRPQRLAYGDPRGSLRLRQALQGYLWRARTIRCDLDQIMIVNGSQQGLDLCARLLLDPRERFVMEDPGYRMARQVFEATGATPVAIDVDADGMRTAGLETVEARLAYVTPSHQFPLGGVMPVARRHQLLDWARARSAYVLEDDYDSEYRYDINPVPPLHSLQPDAAVIYLGTVSKTLSPMLRIGYLVVPPELVPVFSTAKQITDRHSPVAEQEALARLIETGSYERHVRRVRRLNGERRATLLAALRRHFGDRIRVQGAEAGLHVVVWFDHLPRAREPDLIAAARRLGLGLHPISPLYGGSAGGPDRVGLVMGYAALGLRQIEKGVDLLAEVIARL